MWDFISSWLIPFFFSVAFGCKVCTAGLCPTYIHARCCGLSPLIPQSNNTESPVSTLIWEAQSCFVTCPGPTPGGVRILIYTTSISLVPTLLEYCLPPSLMTVDLSLGIVAQGQQEAWALPGYVERIQAQGFRADTPAFKPQCVTPALVSFCSHLRLVWTLTSWELIFFSFVAVLGFKPKFTHMLGGALLLSYTPSL